MDGRARSWRLLIALTLECSDVSAPRGNQYPLGTLVTRDSFQKDISVTFVFASWRNKHRRERQDSSNVRRYFTWTCPSAPPLFQSPRSCAKRRLHAREPKVGSARANHLLLQRERRKRGQTLTSLQHMRIRHVLLRRQLGPLHLPESHGRLMRLEPGNRPRLAGLSDNVDGLQWSTCVSKGTDSSERQMPRSPVRLEPSLATGCPLRRT